MGSKSLFQILKILFQTGDINIFVLPGVFFSRYVQLKGSFSYEKNIQRWNLRHTLVEKVSEYNVAKFKGKFHHWQNLELCKLVLNVKLRW